MSASRAIDPSEAAAGLLAEFAAAGLQPPPIPMSLAEQLRSCGPWCWTTEPGPAVGRDHESSVQRLVGSDADSLTVAHAGHGRNSWAIHYQLRLGPLVVALQVPWGNAYDHPEVARNSVTDAFSDVRRLIQSLGQPALDRFRGQLVVVSLSVWSGTWGAVVNDHGNTPLDEPVIPSALDLLSR